MPRRDPPPLPLSLRVQGLELARRHYFSRYGSLWLAAGAPPPPRPMAAHPSRVIQPRMRRDREEPESAPSDHVPPAPREVEVAGAPGRWSVKTCGGAMGRAAEGVKKKCTQAWVGCWMRHCAWGADYVFLPARRCFNNIVARASSSGHAIKSC